MGPTVETERTQAESRLAPSILGDPVGFEPSETHEAYVVMVEVMPAGDHAPPLHSHPHTDEAFYIVEGEMTFQLGDREMVAGAGDVRVHPPRGWSTPYGIRDRCAGLLLLSPGGAEHIFQPVDNP